MTHKACWLIEGPKFWSAAGFARSAEAIKAAAENQGIKVITGNRSQQTQSVTLSEPITDEIPIVYGSIQFIRDLQLPNGFIAYSYDGTDWANVASRIPREFFVNHDWYMTTIGDMFHDPDRVRNLLDTDAVFIRPNSSKKTFAGDVVDFRNGRHSLEILMGYGYTQVNPQELIVVSKPKHMIAEYRFFILNNRIIAQTQYPNRIQRCKPAPGIVVRNMLDVPDMVLDKVREILQLPPLQGIPFLDPCFTLDMGIFHEDNKVKIGIMEFNSFCSAGTYSADHNAIVEKVTEFAIRDISI